MNKQYTSIELKMQEDYDAIAPSFARSRYNLHWPELDHLIAEVPAQSKVLDIGSGSGRVCRFFGEKQVEYTGIDISGSEIALAKQACPDKRFVQGSMLDLPFKDQEFDVVFMVASLHHLISEEERLKALTEARRVLKSGGKFYMTVMGLWLPKYRHLFFSKREGKQTLPEELKKQIKWNDVFLPWTKESSKIIFRYYHAFTLRELSKLIKASGFQIESFSYMRDGSRCKWYQGKNIVVVAKKMV